MNVNRQMGNNHRNLHGKTDQIQYAKHSVQIEPGVF